jgi:hypothetical protein
VQISEIIVALRGGLVLIEPVEGLTDTAQSEQAERSGPPESSQFSVV